MVSLALAIVAVAAMNRAQSALRLARAEFERAQLEATLDSAATIAVASVAHAKGPGPYQWSVAAETTSVEVLAEPEWRKIGPDSSTLLTDAVLAKLVVTDKDALRRQFGAMTDKDTTSFWQVEGLAVSTDWRRCGASLASVYGRATSLSKDAPGQPMPDAPNWRIGEVWRIVAHDKSGWSDERYVRFSGDPNHPADILDRRLIHRDLGGTPCTDAAKAAS